MLPLNPWEHQSAVKALYSKCVENVCEKHHITRMELDILLFLANNPRYDTAADMIEIRYLSKSQVSASIKILEKEGYLQKKYAPGNRKTAHLILRDRASGIIADGRAAQERFMAVMFRDISKEEIDIMKKCNAQILKNIYGYLRQDEAGVDEASGKKAQENLEGRRRNV